MIGLYPGPKGNNEDGVKSKFVGKMAGNLAFLQDPRVGHEGSRALGWTSNTGNYFGADGSQGTVLNVNTTAGHKYKLTLCKSLCIRIMSVAVLKQSLLQRKVDLLVDRHVERSATERLFFDLHTTLVPNEWDGQLALHCNQASYPCDGSRNSQSNSSRTVASTGVEGSLLDTDV